ncbi:MAG: T9SS type A sorting domain-containing protein [Flavobacteriaceae bacterium]|nr:T9SS type A sorting domain-containing protein [Flavobacteriaceae bacterium]
MKKFVILTIILFTITNNYSQCGQYIHNKLSRLSDVRFWDENNGFVIGASTLLTTHNGGISWDSYELPNFESFYYNPLNDTEIINDNKAIIFGADGIVLYTEDKGNNWIRKVVRTGLENFTGTFFINENIGYVVGVDNYLIDNTAFIYKTLDGGLTWTKVNSNISNLGFGDFFPEDVYFVNENIGYVWGGQNIYKTVNAGKNWVGIINPSNSYIQKVEFIDNQTAYLSAGDFIYLTTDSCQSWTNTGYYVEWTEGAFKHNNGFIYYGSYINQGINRVNIASGETINYPINQSGYITDIFFINNNIGFVVGKREQGNPSMGRFIYKTNDAGLSWTPLDNSSTAGYAADFIYFNKTGPNNYLLSVRTNGGSGNYTIQSNDNANSWQIINGYDVDGRVLYANDNYICHVRYANPQNSADGVIFSESYNNGITWENGGVVQTLPNSSFHSWQKTLGGRIFCKVDCDFYYSDNNSLNWNELNMPSNLELCASRIFFKDSNHGYIYGMDSSLNDVVIYETNDGGNSWNNLVVLNDYCISWEDQSIDFSDDNKLYFIPGCPGYKIFIYDLNSGNLSNVDLPNEYSYAKIKHIDDNSFIIMAGSDPNIYISNDQGVTWKQRFWTHYSELYPNIYVVDNDNIILWGENYIQNLKSYLPKTPETIFGPQQVLINTETEYLIPVDLFVSSVDWVLSSGGDLIINDNSFYYKAKVLWNSYGTHTLKVKLINDCGESEYKEINIEVVSVLGSPELITKKTIVFPNPFNNEINIDLGSSYLNEKVSLKLYNMLGQTIYEDEILLNDELNIKLKDINMNEGIYILSLNSKKNNEIFNLIKE